MTVRNYPQYSFINAITNALNPTITFVTDHDFTVGEIVSFRVGKYFGMVEINNVHSKVISKTSDSITVEHDTTNFTPFSYALIDTEGTSPPVCVPSGSGAIPAAELPSINSAAAFDKRKF